MTSCTPVRPLVAPLVDGEDDVVSVPDVEDEDPAEEEVQQDGQEQNEESEAEEAVRPIALRDRATDNQ